jgi:hypothetical protein
VTERIERAREADARLGRFLRKLAGGFAARKIAGTERTSAHAFGIAIDLDKSLSDYWRWQKRKPLRWRNRFPQAIVDAFEAEGFIWGGRWYHYDTMHFEYRPELFGPPCREPVSANGGASRQRTRRAFAGRCSRSFRSRSIGLAHRQRRPLRQVRAFHPIVR